LTAQLVEGGSGFSNAIIGAPFPIPKKGLEVIWNHLVRFRGIAISYYNNSATPMPDGAYNLVVDKTSVLFPYCFNDAKFEDLNNILLYYKDTILSPSRLAGSVLLVHETINQVQEQRKAWQYNPGQRRVRRAPNVAYDNPSAVADGVRTNDDYDMFNGATDRYNWKLIGKKEIYIPYNTYKLHGDANKVSDILKAGHINSDLVRYELHRVWVVEANLKDGMSHIYKKRVFYIDEDSWSIVAADQYDNHGELWRAKEAYTINYYSVPLTWRVMESVYDLQSGRYAVIGLDNEHSTIDFKANITPADFSPASLRNSGMR
ncbi:MAG: DUF1329 domain-containing protein, partial [Nitrospinae bacterium]|nr:DUF1329 domain-containing protein [Nitrospinota bacterium]